MARACSPLQADSSVSFEVTFWYGLAAQLLQALAQTALELLLHTAEGAETLMDGCIVDSLAHQFDSSVSDTVPNQMCQSAEKEVFTAIVLRWCSSPVLKDVRNAPNYCNTLTGKNQALIHERLNCSNQT